MFVGAGVGLFVGAGVGLFVGAGVGLFVGAGVGLPEGAGVGLLVGAGVGALVGESETHVIATLYVPVLVPAPSSMTNHTSCPNAKFCKVTISSSFVSDPI